MGKKLELTGQRFGRWLVIGESDRGKSGRILWKCICDCGNERSVAGYSLKNGDSKSCGCLNREKISERCKADLIGQRFCRLVVLEESQREKRCASVKWLCHCDCGKGCVVTTGHLMSGHTKSCGCLVSEFASKRMSGEDNPGFGKTGKNNSNYKHGLAGTRSYENAVNAKYRATKLNQTPDNANLQKIQLYYTICAYLNKPCEIPMWHVDHIKPISKGGLHHEDNLQILTAAINLQKNAKHPLTEEEEIKYKGIRI